MNQEQIKGQFDQLKGKIKQTWGRLSDDDIALYNGHQDEFFGKVEEVYGIAKEEAQERLRDLQESGSNRAA